MGDTKEKAKAEEMLNEIGMAYFEIWCDSRLWRDDVVDS